MRDKLFTYADRVSVYVEGKRAFAENRLRSYNPYAASKEFAGLWWHGWDTAKVKIKGERSPLDKRALCPSWVVIGAKMTEIINPMKKQVVYAEGKLAFAFGSRRASNPYKWRNKELASIWVDGWDQAKTDNAVKKNRVTI